MFVCGKNDKLKTCYKLWPKKPTNRKHFRNNECRKLETQIELPEFDIDTILEKEGLYILNSFKYIVGDCLFDSFQYLLHNKYTSTKLQKGTIDYYMSCLQRGEKDAIDSYNLELNSQTLYDLHKVTSIASYLHRMQLSASPTRGNSEIGLWGDVFCIHWLSKWLNIQECVWSLTRGKKYLHFNSTSHAESYSLLFHDNNPLYGHFEPLVSSKFSFTNDQLQQQFNNASTHK